ncbi:MAG: exo-alpha-sialidase, partial [Candidatus Aminicenantes bacterium]|nr:exo-alpha-sialidase [Candidatus Aminicenantes bacterium]
GKTWQAARRLTTEHGISNPLALAVSGNSVYVAWSHAIYERHQVICFRKSSDRGANWGAVQRFKEESGLSMCQRLAASGSNVYLIWPHWNTDERTNTEIYFAASSNRGASWGPVVRLTDNPKVDELPVCAAAGSKVYASWADNRSGNFEIYVRTSANGGASWAGAKRLTKSAGESTYPDLALGDAALYAVWADATAGNHEIYFAVRKLPK